jgi:putative mRNA 3-end processing factor
MHSSPLIAWTERGLYCAAGDFYIDPTRPVKRAVITHAHSDHARRGSEHYYCVRSSVGLLRARLGSKIAVSGISYRESFRLGEVNVSFHSAGHILGSAQVRVENRGEVWVASGDYKREADPSCEPFEIVPCDTFITEATFGTPKYVWEKSRDLGRDIFEWWEKNDSENRNSVLFGYSLGKAQRILALLAPFARKPVAIYSTIEPLNRCYLDEGIVLAPTVLLDSETQYHGALILAPPSALSEPLREKLGEHHTAFASGWMQTKSRIGYDHGFVLSDHADWNALNQTVQETGARQVFVQHRNGALVRHLRRLGIAAHPVEDLSSTKFAKIPAQNLELF